MTKLSTPSFNSAKKESIYLARRRSVLSELRGNALLLFAAPAKVSSRDVNHPYRQESNFFYLTGIEEAEAALLLRGTNKGSRSTLFIREKDPVKERWEGKTIGVKKARRLFSHDRVFPFDQISEELPKLLAGCHKLYTTIGVNPELDELVLEIFRSQVAPNPKTPVAIEDARYILSQKRRVKEKNELRIIKHSVDITAHAFKKLLPDLKSATSELHAAKMLEANFVSYGADRTAFPTIVAAGKNSTCLHHTPTLHPLWKRELVLIDAGASFRGYASDLTRTVPASGKFSKAQAEIYDIVLKALRKATNRAREGASFKGIHNAAAKAITQGLLDLGILKGRLESLMEQEAYKEYFMHGIGHPMGLDVHDIYSFDYSKPFDPKREDVLEAGQVITIEPGIYIDPKDYSVPKHYRGIGIRIEDDVLIKEDGCEVLSKNLPTEREALEELMAGPKTSAKIHRIGRKKKS